MDDKLYGTSLIAQMSHGKETFVKRMLEVFTEDAPIYLARIEKGIEEQNFEEVQSSSHSFIPNLKMLQIPDAPEAARQINDLAKEGKDMDTIRELFAELNKRVMQVVKQINEDLGKNA